ncbi:MAG TPA: hypothetical protein PK131_03370, partial [Candidatus Woesebacteria bacterium]|nr:hypothetical protein [Candidatus Woesebacteria bacterium]
SLLFNNSSLFQLLIFKWEDKMPTITFYSVKSRKSIDIDVAKVKKVILKNGRPAAEAIDPETGTKMFKILSAADAALLK